MDGCAMRSIQYRRNSYICAAIQLALSLRTRKLTSNTTTETASLLKNIFPFFRSSRRFFGVAFSVFCPSAKPHHLFSLPEPFPLTGACHHGQPPSQARKHIRLCPQQEFTKGSQEQEEQDQSDDDLEFHVDDKGVDLWVAFIKIPIPSSPSSSAAKIGRAIFTARSMEEKNTSAT